ncbi:MAG: glycerol-3-phosphate 1-O-acyltransferase PlsY [Bacteroidales bacterium]
MTDSLNIVIAILLAYATGSIPSAVWVGKLFYGIDVRTRGSGNAGATNTIRVLGLKAGIPVLLFDVFKGWLAVYFAVYFTPADFTYQQEVTLRIAMAVAAVLGHVFPVFAGFRGGKGIATLLGVGIALYPYAALSVLGIFILVFIVGRYVSVASITGAIAFPLLVIFVFNPHSLPLILLAVFVGIFVPVTHHKNIKRLINGTENRFSFSKKK